MLNFMPFDSLNKYNYIIDRLVPY